MRARHGYRTDLCLPLEQLVWLQARDLPDSRPLAGLYESGRAAHGEPPALEPFNARDGWRERRPPFDIDRQIPNPIDACADGELVLMDIPSMYQVVHFCQGRKST